MSLTLTIQTRVVVLPRRWMALASLVVMPTLATAQTARTRASRIELTPTTPLELINARAIWVGYRGRRALELAPLEGHEHDTDQEIMAVLTGSDFKDGVIEVDVSGARRQGYSTAEDVSGFKGSSARPFAFAATRPNDSISARRTRA